MNLRLIFVMLALHLFVSVGTAQTKQLEGEEAIASKQDKVGFLIGGGIVVSPGYNDYVKESYRAGGYDDESGLGWLDLYAGIEFKLKSNFSIMAGSDLWVNKVEIEGGSLDESYLNTIIIPSIYGKFYFDEAKTFYVTGGLLIPFPSSNSDNFEFENDGIGLGGGIGLSTAEDGTGINFEFGYIYVPVEAKATESNPSVGGGEDYNFGGIQLRALLAF